MCHRTLTLAAGAELALVVAFHLAAVSALDNGLGRVPQMGWNSWYNFGCDVTEERVKASARALVDTGLAAAGYTYVSLDDCWAGSRDVAGIVHEDPKAFPSGMKALADYVHSLGLLFGVYSDAGTHTCAGRPGSLDFEKNDAKTYASWGVDYLKYDNCYDDGTKPEVRYPVMRDALNATGRPIFFSMCEWGVDEPYKWAPTVGNSWRSTQDIVDTWDGILLNIDENDVGWAAGGPGGWNDPDMIQVGNGALSFAESKAVFSLWCIAKSPLLIGCDITNMTSETLLILTNPEAIAVNQDTLGVQGHKVFNSSGLEVWAGPLADGSVAALLLNRSPSRAAISANFADIGLKGSTALVRDLWTHVDLGAYSDRFTAAVDSHDVVFVKITPTAWPTTRELTR
jgi:alpha-galactosidase